jgi:hypothetical protein
MPAINKSILSTLHDFADACFQSGLNCPHIPDLYGWAMQQNATGQTGQADHSGARRQLDDAADRRVSRSAAAGRQFGADHGLAEGAGAEGAPERHRPLDGLGAPQQARHPAGRSVVRHVPSRRETGQCDDAIEGAPRQGGQRTPHPQGHDGEREPATAGGDGLTPMAETFDFSEALSAIKTRRRVARSGWNGKGMFLFLVPGSAFKVDRPPLLGIYPEGTPINYHGHIDMKTAQGYVVPWVASQSDLLADDWFEVQEKP